MLALPLFYQGVSRKVRNQKALQYLQKVGLYDWAGHLPSELSGGQKQRVVAIARALAAEPKVLLADEPTGALDSKTSYEVMDLIQKINDEGNTILVVTHEGGYLLANMCKRIVHLKDGVIISDKHVEQVKELPIMFSRETLKEIFETLSKNKLRTFLTGFTVSLGILIFVTLFGMGNGLKILLPSCLLGMQPISYVIFPHRPVSPMGATKPNAI